MTVILYAMLACTAFAEGDNKEARFDYSNMRQDELTQLIDVLDKQVDVLKKNRKKYKPEINPEYRDIQDKIEELEGEREAAYKTWFTRGHTP